MALVVQKVISFSYFVIIARALGPDDLGKYYFAISFTTIFAILIDLGLANVLTREVAKKQEGAEKYLANNLAIKVPLAFLTIVLVTLLSYFFHYSELVRTLIFVSCISMVLDSFTLTFWAVMRGFHNLKYESLASIIFQLIIFSSGVFSLYLGWGLLWLMAALALASIFGFAYSFLTVLLKTSLRLRLEFDRPFVKDLALLTLPFAAFAIFQRIYTYVDSVMLQSLSGDRSVGIYQVAFKIINALQFLPAAFSASLYPAFSSYWHKNREQLPITFERALNYLLIISVPISIGIFAVSDKVVALFSHGYSEAILPLQVTILSTSFVFLNFALGALLNACDRQIANTKIIAIAAVTCIAINWYTIPRYGALGATIADSITNTLIFVLGWFYIPKEIKFNALKIWRQAGKVLLGGLLMGYVATILKEQLNVFLVIAISGAIYFVLLFILKVFRKEDVVSIINSFKRKTA
jgi:O-antigen/teichoic acid export membrane protein